MFCSNPELLGFSFLGHSDLKVLLVQEHNRIKCFCSLEIKTKTCGV